jgi:alkylresorcinol/alkylpyrone synthase
MPLIISVAEAVPSFGVKQEDVAMFAEKLFGEHFKDIERLLPAFKNGHIEKRYFAKELEWYSETRSFEEKNNAYMEAAVELGIKAIEQCLTNQDFLKEEIPCQEIDMVYFISTTGLSTPSIDARIMNRMPFRLNTKRMPIWGLGCAGGVSGLSRAYEYCLAFPKAKVLVVCVELCSLTFQKNDISKSNLIGTSLFADGAACALICGDEASINHYSVRRIFPSITAVRSNLMPDSLDVMGWDIKDQGLFVVFSRDIPKIIETWLKPNIEDFLLENGTKLDQISRFILHPGGKKVLDAYQKSLSLSSQKINLSFQVLNQFGNMSSVTIFFVLKRHLEIEAAEGELGLAAALGPGFSSEFLLMRWI